MNIFKTNKTSAVITVIIIIVLGLIAWGGYSLLKKPKEEAADFSKNLIVSQSSMQGMLSATYLFENRSFININELTQISGSEEPQCYEGKISSEAYNSFMEFIKSSGFFDTRITQKDDLGLLCEGTYIVEVNIDDKSNSLSLPCVSEYTESTKKVESIMKEASKELNEIINTSKQICRQGGFIITYDMGGCTELVRQHKEWYDEELKYETYQLPDLDSNLKKSLMYEGAYVYIGPIDETIESYHRKYYAIGDSCYFVMLAEFNGSLFKSYDEVIKEKE